MIRSLLCVCLLLLCTALTAAERPWLGITPDVSPGFDHQVIVKTVRANSTAQEMGLKPNDIITDLASDKKNWSIKGIDDLADALNQHQPGDTIRIGVKRSEETLTLQGVLKKRPARQNLNQTNKDIQKQLQQLSQLKDNSNTNAALALSLHGLSKTLEQLPEKIEEAAREFKEVYPDGEFKLKVEISISSSKLDDTENEAGNELQDEDEDKAAADTDTESQAEKQQEDDQNGGAQQSQAPEKDSTQDKASEKAEPAQDKSQADSE